ncbi:cilia- and flagella-associated protein 298 isoform X2 [Hyalella azteca]|uniref:Cilia- and flagella-associated protein 298 isoform X2 n=1 Tax=Hyalella azteca TaxID=294128 RepID=A0A8B7P4U6_HYAAZ|nr:cilia- and flagella-associated protein 298 isoform X2 [Hyalella azteca]
MVLLHVKKGQESLFLLEASTVTPVSEVLRLAVSLHNDRLGILDTCAELELLACHGAALPPAMHGLLQEQAAELRLTDDWTPAHPPTGGFSLNKDPCGRRNGQQPTAEMQEVLRKAVAEAKGIISKENVKNNRPLTEQHMEDCLEMLKGCVSLVYPDGLPSYDVIAQRLHRDPNAPPLNRALEAPMSQLWFAGKALDAGKSVGDCFGRNEKTKAVVQLGARGEVAPVREPQLDEAQQASMMAYWHQRRQQLKKLDENDDDSYLDSAWADSHGLQRQFHGLENIKWRPA